MNIQFQNKQPSLVRLWVFPLLVAGLIAGLLTGSGCYEATSVAIADQDEAKIHTSQSSDRSLLEQQEESKSANRTSNLQESTQEEVTQEEAKQEPSPLDAAVKTLEEKEISDPRDKPEVEPREIHEALKPLIQEHWVRLHPGYEVWLDNKEKQVIVGGRISLTDGLLEMFACPMGTKEHESVISTVSNAEVVHVGLLAAGAVKGKPANWTEETGLITAKGPVCNITIAWQEDQEKKEVRAQEMVLDRSTGKSLTHEWVFCGSAVWVDPEDPSDREYQADWGDMICVSNFPTAMMDLTVESSSAADGLMFVANPDKVPALGTPVLIRIKPDLDTNPSEEAMEKSSDASDDDNQGTDFANEPQKEEPKSEKKGDDNSDG